MFQSLLFCVNEVKCLSGLSIELNLFKVEGTLFVTYTAYSEIWSLRLAEEQWAATA